MQFILKITVKDEDLAEDQTSQERLEYLLQTLKHSFSYKILKLFNEDDCEIRTLPNNGIEMTHIPTQNKITCDRYDKIYLNKIECIQRLRSLINHLVLEGN